MPSVNFIKVKTAQEKLAAICTLIQDHYDKGDKILISVQNEETAQYIDQLLWKSPAESFLPHSIAEGPTEERIAITTREQNVNQAAVLFNLHPGRIAIAEPYEQVYELYDLTSKDKEKVSQKKQQDYQAAGY